MRKAFKRIFAIFVIVSVFCGIGCKGAVDIKPIEKYGTIEGKAFYSNENVDNHSGIQITLVSTDGLMATDFCSSRGISTNARSVKDIKTTVKDGSYSFKNIPEGVYTVYASSNSTVEKAVTTNILVNANQVVTAEDLKLTATGAVRGNITIDGSTAGTLGLDVFIAGTSFDGKVGSDGSFELTGIPAKKGYVLCVQKGDYTSIIDKNLEVLGNDTVKIQAANILSENWKQDNSIQEYPTFKWLGVFVSAPKTPDLYDAYYNTEDGCSYIWNGSNWDLLAQAGKDGLSIVWKGSLESAPENPELYWVYYNIEDGCSYIWNGSSWDIISQDGFDGTDGLDGINGTDGKNGVDGLSIVWKGVYSVAPENPELNWAYYNTEDGCSYIWNGSEWDLLAKAGKDGVDGVFTGIYKTFENVIEEELFIHKNLYAENYQVEVLLPFTEILPEKGDKITLKWEFTSNIDIQNLRISLADLSMLEDGWKDLTRDYIIESVNKDEPVIVENILAITSRPVEKVALIIRYNVVDTDAEAIIKTINSSICLQRGENLHEDISANKITCTAIKEGIKFTGSLLSNVTGTESKCEILINDNTNNVLMHRTYVQSESEAYNSWETIYPLVEAGKEYSFEVKIIYQAATIYRQLYTVRAIGGLGEYRVENADAYEIMLSDDKRILSRTPQIFTDNPTVPILEWGTRYAVYSNNEEVTSIWDGIWMHDILYLENDTSDQICDLTKLGWPSYEEVKKKLFGRRLGVRTVTNIYVAGYTYNHTAFFELNDYKEKFFDWDEEDENKYFIMYKNPETNEYFTDVPGTTLYYIQKEFDENGNIVFVDENTDDAIPIYGKLINYGDSISEPAYVPKREHYNFGKEWKVTVGNSQTIDSMKFPYRTDNFGVTGKTVPVILEPKFTPKSYTLTVNDNYGNDICTINAMDFSFTLTNSNIPVKNGYAFLYCQDNNGNRYELNQTYECKQNMELTAVYEQLPSFFNVGDVLLKDGTYIKAENVKYGVPTEKAMAVISNQTLDGRFIGVGIEKERGAYWTVEDSVGYNTYFGGIKVECSGWSEIGYTFVGDVDGSDNWEYVCQIDPIGTQTPEKNYPAFNFVIKYAKNHGLGETAFAEGWYLPSIKELYDINKNIDIVEFSLKSINGFDFYDHRWYWSSSQSATNPCGANEIEIGNGSIGTENDKAESWFGVLAFKAFAPEQFIEYDYGTPSITNVEIPTVGEGYSGEIPVTIRGENLIGNPITSSDASFANVQYISDNLVKATVSRDGNIGEKVINVNCGVASGAGTLNVVESEKCFSVGDILFTDGTRIKAENVQYGIPDEQLKKAFGVIGSASYGGGTGLVVGLQSRSGEWAPSGTTGYETKFTGISVEYSGEVDNYTFTGDLDGSDNWEYICSIDPSGTQDAATNYPIFHYANTYGVTAGLEGTEYENGWYVPSFAELYDVYTNITAIQTSMNAAGGFDIESGWYWSSSQSSFNYYSAYNLSFDSGSLSSYYKDSYNYVLVLQALNAE